MKQDEIEIGKEYSYLGQPVRVIAMDPDGTCYLENRFCEQAQANCSELSKW
jgi:hypothetical protein